jgi:hypothetical protein
LVPCIPLIHRRYVAGVAGDLLYFLRQCSNVAPILCNGGCDVES